LKKRFTCEKSCSLAPPNSNSLTAHGVELDVSPAYVESPEYPINVR
jgi:hypothetical protein